MSKEKLNVQNTENGKENEKFQPVLEIEEPELDQVTGGSHQCPKIDIIDSHVICLNKADCPDL